MFLHTTFKSMPYLKASISRSTFCASPWTLMCAWNFLSASSSSIAEKSISSTTQLVKNTRVHSEQEVWECNKQNILEVVGFFFGHVGEEQFKINDDYKLGCCQ